MSTNLPQFISFMEPANNTDVVTVRLQSFGAQVDEVFTSTTTVNTGDDPETIALKVYQKLVADLTTAGLLYSDGTTGTPQFSDQAPLATWMPTLSDHVVCIWSECQFRMTVTTNLCRFVQDTSPVLMTIAYAKSVGFVFREFFKLADGSVMDDDSLVYTLGIISAYACDFLNNYIVMTTYKHHEICKGGESIQVGKRPIYTWDDPQIRRPYAAQIITATVLQVVRNSFMMVNETGKLGYRFAQNLVWNIEPFAKNNELIMTYVAGNFVIPKRVKDVCLKYNFISSYDPVAKRLRHGLHDVELEPIERVRDAFRSELDTYALASLQ